MCSSVLKNHRLSPGRLTRFPRLPESVCLVIKMAAEISRLAPYGKLAGGIFAAVVQQIFTS